MFKRPLFSVFVHPEFTIFFNDNLKCADFLIMRSCSEIDRFWRNVSQKNKKKKIKIKSRIDKMSLNILQS